MKAYHGSTKKIEKEIISPLFLVADKSYAQSYILSTSGDGYIYTCEFDDKKIKDLTTQYDLISEVEVLLRTVKVNYSTVQKSEDVIPFFYCQEIKAYSTQTGRNPIHVFYIPRVRDYLLKNGYNIIKVMDHYLNTPIETYIILDVNIIKMIEEEIVDVMIYA